MVNGAARRTGGLVGKGLSPQPRAGELFRYPYKVPGGSKPKIVLQAKDGRWYEFFREEIRILWENGTDWQCVENE